MKRVETLSGKNLPRLAVAKPGWPETISLPAEAFEKFWQVIENPPPPTQALIDLMKSPTPWEPSEQAVADFTRVCDQTGLSEKLRK